jgi:peptide/nickel transport system substrate-binding protein
MKKTLIVAISLFLGSQAVAAPFVWSGKWTSSKPNEVKTGGVMRWTNLSDHKTLNPFTTAEAGNIPGQVAATGGFFILDPVTLDQVPYMAESYTVSKDKLTWTFNIRKGMKWSDGKPIVADDWVTTFKIHTDEDVGSNSADSFFINDKPVLVGKVDADTVKISFPSVSATALETVGYSPWPAHVFAPIYAAKGAAGIKAMWTLSEKPENIISSGPFKYVSYKASERLTVEKNPYFAEWNKDSAGNGLPYLDGYVQLIVKDLTADLAQFLAGQTDIYAPPNADALGQIKRAVDGGNLKAVLRANVGPAASSSWIVFNWNRKADPFKQKLFRDVNFRRAMSHITNRAAMVDIVLGGLGAPAYSSVYAAFKDWVSPNVQKFDYNLEAAKGLLAKVGFSKRNSDGWLVDRSGKILEFDLNTNAGNNNREQMAKIFADEAKKIGVKVNFKPIDFNSLVAALLQEGEDRKFDSILLGLANGSIVYPLGNNVEPCGTNLHAFNKSGKCLAPWESQVSALYFRGKSELETAKRKAITHQIQDVQSGAQAWDYLISPNVHNAWNARLHGEFPQGVMNSITGLNYYELAWVSQ